MPHLYTFAKSFLGLACLIVLVNAGAAFGQTGSSLFGDGSDGDVEIGANTTLTRDWYYNNLRIKAGYKLDPGGFRVFVLGTLTLEDGARISRDGNNAVVVVNGVGRVSGEPGAALPAGTLGGSRAGSRSDGAGEGVENSLGGSGGGAWIGMSAGGGERSLPAVSDGGAEVFHSALQALSGRSLDGHVVNGGGGGGGPIGGGGGGVVIVSARRVVASGTTTISADGGGSDWGAGGGGGVVVVITTVPRPSGLTLSAAAGASAFVMMQGRILAAPGFTAWLNSAAEAATGTPSPGAPTITPVGQVVLCNGSVTFTSSSATGNQWYRGDVPIEGETRQTYIATAAGTYNVRITGSGFIEQSAVTTVVDSPPPVFSYLPSFNVPLNGSLTVNPIGQPPHVSYSVVKGAYPGPIEVDSSGVVSINNTTAVGAYTVTIRATNNCGVSTNAAFQLNVISFGDPTSTDMTIKENTTLPSDTYCNNLTISAGKILKTGGFRIFVYGRLTLEDGARISRDGNDGVVVATDGGQVSGNAGAALSGGTLGGSGAGGTANEPGESVENSLGGSGGGGQSRGMASSPDSLAGGGDVFRSPLLAISGCALNSVLVKGGAGGAGLLGGGGGGVVVIVAREVVVSSGTATISANGGFGGWGGGGGGGVVVVVSNKPQPAGLILSANGGDAPALLMSGLPAAGAGFTAWLY